ncbi:hypothetical protein [Terrarubrum flagellatum]|uniref:hypothetical protein n=1 Tax=Terrirubrum flagellatum TaxID=2895980 RepID=UPI0031456D38
MIAKFVLVAVVLAMVLYEQMVLRQLRKQGRIASTLGATATLFREITARALKGSAAAQLHHAALLGLALWLAVGFGYHFLTQS